MGRVNSYNHVTEDVRQLLQELRLPAADLVGVDAEIAGQLSDRSVALGRLKSHFGLEGRIVGLPHTR